MTVPSTIGPTVRLVLCIIGVWPTSYVILSQIFWSATIAFIQTFQFWYIALNLNGDNLAQFFDGLSTTFAYTLIMVKLIVFWINRRTFENILTSMSMDWKESSSIEGGTDIMMSKVSMAHFISNLIISIYASSTCFYGTDALISRALSKNDTLRREFILKMILPFECNESPNYEFVILTQFLHQFMSSTTAGAVSSLMVCFILHLGGQVDIICNAVEKISSKHVEGGTSIVEIKTVIVHHQKIIVFCNNIEYLFTYIALGQFLINTMLICCQGFMIVISLGSANEMGYAALSKAILFYVAMVIEAFVICFAGEYVSAKGKVIGEVAYDSLWYELKPSESRILMLLILRSQRRLAITAGKVMDLSLETFTTILKTSASYMSVIHAMY